MQNRTKHNREGNGARTHGPQRGRPRARVLSRVRRSCTTTSTPTSELERRDGVPTKIAWSGPAALGWRAWLTSSIRGAPRGNLPRRLLVGAKSSQAEGQDRLRRPEGLGRMRGQKLLDGPSQGGLGRMRGANLRLSSGHPQVGYYPAHIHSRKSCEGF